MTICYININEIDCVWEKLESLFFLFWWWCWFMPGSIMVGWSLLTTKMVRLVGLRSHAISKVLHVL